MRVHRRSFTILMGAVLIGASVGPVAEAADPTLAAAPSSPAGGTELYGYLPYWEMSATMAAYLPAVPLTTIGLFSVTAGGSGALQRTAIGYRRIAGQIGGRLVAEAHARGQRAELVFSSFGSAKNGRLFGLSRPDDRLVRRGGPDERNLPSPPWVRTATELVALTVRLGLDGVNVDVESIPGDAFEGYTAFLAALRSRLDAGIGNASLSAATMASSAGADLARAAIAGGVDRVFLMGYDYHWSGSDPGAQAPLARTDGGLDLRASIARYGSVGVPPDRIILGLPLFGMTWPVASPDLGAPRTGAGATWIPGSHPGLLNAAAFVSTPDWLEATEFFATADAAPSAGWHVTFYDSPRTLEPKLQLARASGFAGAGFWAIGYERGLPGYLELMRHFRRGDIVPVERVSLQAP